MLARKLSSSEVSKLRGLHNPVVSSRMLNQNDERIAPLGNTGCKTNGVLPVVGFLGAAVITAKHFESQLARAPVLSTAAFLSR